MRRNSKHIKIRTFGLERWFSGSEHLWLLLGTLIACLAMVLRGSSVYNSWPRDLILSSGLYGYMNSHTHALACMCVHTQFIFKKSEQNQEL